MNRGPFSRRSALLLAIAGGSSLVASFLVLVFAPTPLPQTAGPGVASVSALGHRALVEILDELGYQVLAGHRVALAADRATSLLVFAEPEPKLVPKVGAHLARQVQVPGRGLLVLPKREVVSVGEQLGWAGDTDALSLAEVQQFLVATGFPGTVRRCEAGQIDTASWWTDGLPVPTLPAPQFIQGTGIEAVVSCDQGILVGRRRSPGFDLTVVSDPDVLCNAGIGLGDNAPFIVALFERLTERQRVVVFDELCHGPPPPRSVWHELGRFPLVLLLAHAFLLLALAFWIAAGRFGSPLPEAPPLEAGKARLIANTAELLGSRGRSVPALDAYFAERVRATARALHLPESSALCDTVARIEALVDPSGDGGPLRALASEVSELPREGGVSSGRLVALARRIHRITQEIAHGRR